MIYLLHIYCIFARYTYDILINYICFLLFLTNILYCQLHYNGDAWVYMMGEVTWHGERVLFLCGKACYLCSSEIIFLVQLLLYRSKNIFSTSCILYAWLAISHVPFVLNSVLIVMYKVNVFVQFAIFKYCFVLECLVETVDEVIWHDR